MAHMAKTKWFVSFASLAVLAIAIGCSGGKDPEPAGTDKGGGGAGETAMVTADQASAVLTTNCMPCHGGENPKKGFNLESVDNAVNTGAITKGDAASSMIVKAMKGDGAKKMPPQGSVSDADIKTVEDWINAQS